MAKEFGRLSNTFYRLVRKDEFGKYDVCDFKTIVNGNLYIQEHENAEIDQNGYIINACYHDKIKKTTKEIGNARYNQLKSRGYKLVGIFEQDVCGYERRIK